MVIRKASELRYSDVTPRQVYLNRRRFLASSSLALGTLASPFRGVRGSERCSKELIQHGRETDSLRVRHGEGRADQAGEELPHVAVVSFAGGRGGCAKNCGSGRCHETGSARRTHLPRSTIIRTNNGSPTGATSSSTRPSPPLSPTGWSRTPRSSCSAATVYARPRNSASPLRFHPCSTSAPIISFSSRGRSTRHARCSCWGTSTRSAVTGSMTSPRPSSSGPTWPLCSGQGQQRRQTLPRDSIGPAGRETWQALRCSRSC